MQVAAALLQDVRPFLIKGVAVLMGICYLLAPMHRQMGIVLHSVSHFLEMPGHVMSHAAVSNHDSFTKHQHEAHEKLVNVHKHQVIDFLDSIFKASNHEGESQDALTTQIKIDKHFIISKYTIAERCVLKLRNGFSKVACEYREGYYRQLYNPPRIYSLA